MRRPTTPGIAAPFVVSILLALPLLLAGCSADDVVAVGGAGGVYQPGGACTREEGGGAQCRDLGALHRFEQPDGHGFVASASQGAEPGTVGDFRVSCARSYCGTGSLAVRANLKWQASRLVSIRQHFDSPIDLTDKTFFAQVLAEPFDTPMNAQIAIIHEGIWRQVAWNVMRRGWNVVEGVVSTDNPLLKVNTTGRLMASAIVIDVYLATELRNGRDRWDGEIFVDEIGWR